MLIRSATVSVFGLGIVLIGALVANAYTVPVMTYGGNITVGCERTPLGDGYDEVDFYLTGMLGSAAGLGTDGTQVRINIIEGRWTVLGGGFWVNSNMTSRKSHTVNAWWGQVAGASHYSTINFDSAVSGATIWTNTAGGGGAGTFTGNTTTFFSGSWYTTERGSDLVYGNGGPNPPETPFVGPNPSYIGPDGADSTILAKLYVTNDTPWWGMGFGAFPGSTGSGKMSFSYGGGIVENVAFATYIPEPGSLALLLAAVVGLAAYAWRRRSRL